MGSGVFVGGGVENWDMCSHRACLGITRDNDDVIILCIFFL